MPPSYRKKTIMTMKYGNAHLPSMLDVIEYGKYPPAKPDRLKVVKDWVSETFYGSKDLIEEPMRIFPYYDLPEERMEFYMPCSGDEIAVERYVFKVGETYDDVAEAFLDAVSGVDCSAEDPHVKAFLEVYSTRQPDFVFCDDCVWIFSRLFFMEFSASKEKKELAGRGLVTLARAWSVGFQKNEDIFKFLEMPKAFLALLDRSDPRLVEHLFLNQDLLEDFCDSYKAEAAKYPELRGSVMDDPYLFESAQYAVYVKHPQDRYFNTKGEVYYFPLYSYWNGMQMRREFGENEKIVCSGSTQRHHTEEWISSTRNAQSWYVLEYVDGLIAQVGDAPGPYDWAISALPHFTSEREYRNWYRGADEPQEPVGDGPRRMEESQASADDMSQNWENAFNLRKEGKFREALQLDLTRLTQLSRLPQDDNTKINMLVSKWTVALDWRRSGFGRAASWLLNTVRLDFLREFPKDRKRIFKVSADLFWTLFDLDYSIDGLYIGQKLLEYEELLEERPQSGKNIQRAIGVIRYKVQAMESRKQF